MYNLPSITKDNQKEVGGTPKGMILLQKTRADSGKGNQVSVMIWLELYDRMTEIKQERKR